MEPDQVTFESFARLILKAGFTLETGPKRLRREMAIVVMTQNGGNQCKSARDLGMHRNTLGRLLKEEQIPTARSYWCAAKKKPVASVPLWNERGRRA